jgi:hypothetical protein
MSTVVRNNLQKLASSIRANYKHVDSRVCSPARKPNRGIVVSIAKYKEALDKLSKE